MVRFQDHVTPLDAENLNRLVDGIENNEIKANKALKTGEDALVVFSDKAEFILNLFNEFVKIFGNQITVEEFDNLLSVQQFDNKMLTAAQFDTIGRTLLL